MLEDGDDDYIDYDDDSETEENNNNMLSHNANINPYRGHFEDADDAEEEDNNDDDDDDEDFVIRAKIAKRPHYNRRKQSNQLINRQYKMDSSLSTPLTLSNLTDDTIPNMPIEPEQMNSSKLSAPTSSLTLPPSPESPNTEIDEGKVIIHSGLISDNVTQSPVK